MKQGKVAIKDFKIETFDEGVYLTFFTQAKDHKKALRNLQTNSSDYKKIVSSSRTLTIKVTEK
jgi:hypothetical protein